MRIHEPHVSVVIPVYNAERYLGEAIRTVREQSARSIELIVVDDGSTDGSAALAHSLAPDALHIPQSNQGPGAARNVGALHAQGEFLAFLDADDLWTPQKFALQLAAFDADPTLHVVTGHVQQFRSPELDPEIAARLHCPERPMPGLSFGAMLFRRETFERVGQIDTKLTLAEMFDWVGRAQAMGMRFLTLPDVVLMRRLHTSNLSIRHRAASHDYARALKASLDHRRAIHGQNQGITKEAG